MLIQTVNPCTGFAQRYMSEYPALDLKPVVIRDPERRMALDHANAIIALLGGKPVDRLLPGKPKQPDDCAIARTIRQALGGRYAVVVGGRYTQVVNPAGQTVFALELPETVKVFIQRFDHAHYHDLVT